MVVIKTYQNSVLLLAISYTVFFFLPYAWPYIYANQTVDFLALAGFNGKVDLAGPLPFLIGMFYIISYVGLYYFHPAGRLLFTALVIFNLTLAPYVLGYYATAYLDSAIGYLVTLLEGCVLYMVYFTDISGKFKKYA